MSDGYDYEPIAGEPGTPTDGGNTDFRAPYVGYSPNAALFKTVGNSAYDALETHVEKRLSHNFQAGASYTWSHALDEQSDIGLFFTGDNPNKLRDSWASSDFDRTHVFSANFQVDIPNVAKEHSLASYFANDWHLTGIGILQSGEPYSLYEFYGAVGSIYFGNYPTLMNPVLGIKDPSHPKCCLDRQHRAPSAARGGSYIPAIDPTQIAINYLAPGTERHSRLHGQRSAGHLRDRLCPLGSAISSARPMQKRLDISIRKKFQRHRELDLQYEFNVFNVTNTTSLDVPMDQAQIRQNSACSNTAITATRTTTTAHPATTTSTTARSSPATAPTDQQSALSQPRSDCPTRPALARA